MTTFVEPPFWARHSQALGPDHVGVSLKTAPQTEPITVAEAKIQCRIDPDIVEEDWLLKGLIQAARMDCEAYTDLGFITQTVRETRPRFPGDRSPLTLRKRPVQVTPTAPIITYTDASGAVQTLDAATYTVDAPAGPYPEHARILPVFDTFYWPFPSLVPVLNGVTIEYVVGFGNAATDVPWPLRQAMLLLIGIWYANREAGQIIRGSADVLPFGVTSLLDKYVPAGVV